MSKNIIIQEGGEGRQFTAEKLQTALVGGGSCLWIPEDEVRLGTKSITEDGTYEASGDGLYGYSAVTVRGIGKVTGKDPVTGEETQVTTEKDPQTGEQTIVTKTIPSNIVITKMPSKLTYSYGDLIDIAGFDGEVKLYLKSGQLFTDDRYPDGVLPLQELSFPVKTAVRTSIPVQWDSIYDGKTLSDQYSITIESLDLGPIQAPVIGSQTGLLDDQMHTMDDGLVTFGRVITTSNILYIYASTNPNAKCHVTGGGHDFYAAMTYQFTFGGKTVYYHAYNYVWSYSPVPLAPCLNGGSTIMQTVSDQNIAAAAWVMIYGGNADQDDSGVDAVTGADPVGGNP